MKSNTESRSVFLQLLFLFLAVTVGFVLFLLGFSHFKQISATPLLTGVVWGTFHPILTLSLFKHAKKFKPDYALMINFLGIVFRFAISLLILVLVMMMVDKSQFAFFEHLCYSFLAIYFLYIPLEIYALKRIA